MKVQIYNTNDLPNGEQVLVLGRKTKKQKYHLGSITLKSDSDDISEIHIHYKHCEDMTVNEKLSAIKDWSINQGFMIRESTNIGVKVNKFNKETKKHEKVLIDIKDWKG